MTLEEELEEARNNVEVLESVCRSLQDRITAIKAEHARQLARLTDERRALACGSAWQSTDKPEIRLSINIAHAAWRNHRDKAIEFAFRDLQEHLAKIL